MKRRIFSILLVLFLAGCGGGSSGKEPTGLNRDTNPVEEALILQAVYDYSKSSSCPVADIYKEVLILYTNKKETRYAIRKADGSDYLSGDLPETRVITFKGNLRYTVTDPEKKESTQVTVEADCYMEIMDSDSASFLHAHCRSNDPVLNCHMYWE